MKCPRPRWGTFPQGCNNQTAFTELRRSKTDNIDGLDHSHMRCDQCGMEFNVWHEPEDKIKALLGDLYL